LGSLRASVLGKARTLQIEGLSLELLAAGYPGFPLSFIGRVSRVPTTMIKRSPFSVLLLWVPHENPSDSYFLLAAAGPNN
jgi:hypothetical protein